MWLLRLYRADCFARGNSGINENKIIHRGPDSDGSHLDDGIAMGFRRLSFVDLEGGSQPIYNETRDMVITFNGEIYNHRELREELEAKGGHVMGSRADTEVLIHGYEEWGEELLQKAARMFAFVIWDKKNKSIFGARDFFRHQALLLHHCQRQSDLRIRKSRQFWRTPMSEKRSIPLH